jgi:hypothetical protein
MINIKVVCGRTLRAFVLLMCDRQYQAFSARVRGALEKARSEGRKGPKKAPKRARISYTFLNVILKQNMGMRSKCLHALIFGFLENRCSPFLLRRSQSGHVVASLKDRRNDQIAMPWQKLQFQSLAIFNSIISQDYG